MTRRRTSTAYANPPTPEPGTILWRSGSGKVIRAGDIVTARGRARQGIRIQAVRHEVQGSGTEVIWCREVVVANGTLAPRQLPLRPEALTVRRADSKRARARTAR